MSDHARQTRRAGRDWQNWQSRLGLVLGPMAKGYAAVMRLRAELYGSGLVNGFPVPCPCISVGNIAWGGSGKTPLCDWLLTWAARRDLHAVLLSRGYGAAPPSVPYLVGPDSPPGEAGDEPLVMAQSHPEARIVVDPRRARSAAWAWQRWRPDLLVLDDGFQHLAIGRHLDLVLLRTRDMGDQWNRVIPAGSWREDAGGLARASAFLFRMEDEDFAAMRRRIEDRLGRFRKPVFNFSLRPTGLKVVSGPPSRAGDEAAAYILVTGVGDPDAVLATANRFMGYPPERHLVFPDHHAYTQADVEKIVSEEIHCSCRMILCTTKDAVKLKEFNLSGLRTFDLDLVFGASLYSDLSFPEWLDQRFEQIKGLFSPVEKAYPQA